MRVGVDIGYWCGCWIFILTLILDIVIRHRILKLDAKIEIGIHMIHSHWHCLLHIHIGCGYPTSLSIFNSNSNIRHQYLISICHFITHVQYQYPISIFPHVALFFQWFLKGWRNRCSVVVCLSASQILCWTLLLLLAVDDAIGYSSCYWWVLIWVFDIDIAFSYWIFILAFDIDIGHSYWILILMLILDDGYGYWIWILGIDIRHGYWNGIVILDIDIGSWNCHCTGIMLLDSDIQYQYATSNVNADVSYVYQSRY